MEWVLEHLQFVIALVVIVVWVLNNLRRQSAGQDEPDRPDARDVRAPAQTDVDELERTRRIQEEIRRRILARQRGEPVLAPPPPLPVEPAEPPELEEPEWLEEGPRPPPAKPPPLLAGRVEQAAATTVRGMDAAAAAILEQQRLLQEQIDALRAARAVGSAAVPRLPAVYGHIENSKSEAAAVEVRRAVREDLAGRDGLRRAILLREILGQPPGLQRGPVSLPRR